ncbi:hypothetical protein Q3G72_008474 [Acer saccharum]|nr:hypothetical protein Q3G72_008474 [Acer saccharum]
MDATIKPKEFKEYINLKIWENKGENVVKMLEQARLALLRKRFLHACTEKEIDIAFDFKGDIISGKDTHITFIPKEEEDEGEVGENKDEDDKDGGEVDENKDKDEKEDEDGESEKEDSEEEESEGESKR